MFDDHGFVKFDPKKLDKSTRTWSWKDDVRNVASGIGLILGVPAGLFVLFLLGWGVWALVSELPRSVGWVVFFVCLFWFFYLLKKQEQELLAENARLRRIIESNTRDMARFRLDVSDLMWELEWDSEMAMRLRELLKKWA